MNAQSTKVLCYRIIRQLLSTFLSFLAAKPEDLSKIIDFRKVGAFHKAIIGEVDPGLAIQGTELLGHGSHNSAGHTAMGHYRYHTSKLRILHPFDSTTYTENCLTSAFWGTRLLEVF